MACHFIKFSPGSKVFVAGPSGCGILRHYSYHLYVFRSVVGKSQFLLRMLKHNKNCFDPPITNLIWCYGVEQKDFFEEVKKVFPAAKFVSGFPEEQISAGKLFPKNVKGHNLLILDDLMQEVSDSSTFEKIWTKATARFFSFFGHIYISVQSSSRIFGRTHSAKSLSEGKVHDDGQQKSNPSRIVFVR